MKRQIALVVAVLGLVVFGLGACKSPQSTDQNTASAPESVSSTDNANTAEKTQAKEAEGTEALPPGAGDPSLEIATFAGGCFWCMEPPFDKTDGVVRTIVGYTGGEERQPTYKEVSSGQTGHTEAIRVYYDPKKVSYDELLDIFWRNINPTQKDGQFVDIGTQYRTGVYYHGKEQRKLAEESKHTLAGSGRFDEPIVTEIEPAGIFWRAEEYHQNFYKKSPVRYKSYRSGSGRDAYIEKVWGAQ